MREEDDVVRMLRAANPVPPGTEGEPGARQFALRDRIMTETVRRPAEVRRVRPLWWAMLAPLAAVVVAVLALTAPPGPTDTKAAASMPEPMTFTDDGRTMEEIVAEAERALARSSGPAEPRREVVSTGWYYDLDGEATGDPRLAIRPEVVSLTWNEDLSGRIRVVAGEPYWDDLDTDEVPTVVKPPGTLIWEMEFAPGEYQTPVTAAPGESAADVQAFLAASGLTDPASAFEVLNVIDSVTQQWTLTNAQHAQLLRMLLATDDIRVLGSGVDRSDRPVVGLVAPMPSGTAELRMLISQETGRIVGFETCTLTENSGIPAGTVLSYRIWDI